jgi:hypothetical protein
MEQYYVKIIILDINCQLRKSDAELKTKIVFSMIKITMKIVQNASTNIR